MKYWWLEKYRNFRIVQINELSNDVHYFVTMPTNYNQQYQFLQNKSLDTLEEEELLIIIRKIVDTKNIKDNSFLFTNHSKKIIYKDKYVEIAKKFLGH